MPTFYTILTFTLFIPYITPLPTLLPKNNSTKNQNVTIFDVPKNVKKIESKEAPVLQKSITLDELKVRCQHLSQNTKNETQFHHRLINNGNTVIKSNQNKNVEVIRRPVYIHNNKPAFLDNATSRPAGFYITTRQVYTTPRPTTTKRTTLAPSGITSSTTLTSDVKYVRLEPVILQKTIFSDGNVVYYWHKNIPSAIEYPYMYSTPKISSTTTEKSSYLNFRNLLPFYGSSSNDNNAEKIATNIPEISNQFRFILPLPYGNGYIPKLSSNVLWNYGK